MTLPFHFGICLSRDYVTELTCILFVLCHNNVILNETYELSYSPIVKVPDSKDSMKS